MALIGVLVFKYASTSSREEISADWLCSNDAARHEFGASGFLNMSHTGGYVRYDSLHSQGKLIPASIYVWNLPSNPYSSESLMLTNCKENVDFATEEKLENFTLFCSRDRKEIDNETRSLARVFSIEISWKGARRGLHLINAVPALR